MIIRTERLLLRPARADDLEPFHAILSDPQVMRYWSSLPHADMDRTREWLAATMAVAPEDGLDFVIEHDGAVIGKAGSYRFPSIGYVLRRDCWGRGFASEAMRAAIAAVFAATTLDRLDADVDPRNHASIRLLERLGFHETHRAPRTWLIGEEWCDSVYFAIRRGALSR